MGWFDEQLRQRKNSDKEILSDSFVRLAGAVLGHKEETKLGDERLIIGAAIDEILKYYHVRPTEVPDNVKDFDEQLEYKLRPHGIMRRTVKLDPGWYKDAFGPMLAFTEEDQTAIALLPDGFRGYCYVDPASGKKVKINAANEKKIKKTAICFYYPLPMRKIGIPDLLSFMAGRIKLSDYMLIAFIALASAGIMMLIPALTKVMMGKVVESGSKKLLVGVFIFMTCAMLSSQILSAVQNLVNQRIGTKIDISVQAAAMMRTLTMPANFFRNYSSGELSKRLQSINSLSSLLLGMILGSGLTSLASLVYLTQIFRYARPLVLPAFIIILLTILLTVVTSLAQMKIERKQMRLSAKESGISYAMVSGIRKIKLAGAEKRAFAKWADAYSAGAVLKYNPPMFLRLNPAFTLALTLFSSVAMAALAFEYKIKTEDYFAFNAAFGMLSNAFISLTGLALSLSKIPPILDMARPILETEPEISDGKVLVNRLSGGIELSNVSFRYADGSPYIIKDLSLKIKPGEYVAIVGQTGCGKTTLVRLLLGFEKPLRGAVYFDGRDISTMDLRSLRRKIGTVMQGDTLFQGDILSNITISSPDITVEEAWKAAELAGIADDIREMPMGMNTLISEGLGGISGGQKQRLMIARAIASKPRVLIFDEATSALDNKTQKQVSDALDALKCTRLVVAHRLSTIRHCSRIILLADGRIAEDGSYDELIEKGGLFAELVQRQRIEK